MTNDTRATIHCKAIVTMERQHKIICALSSGEMMREPLAIATFLVVSGCAVVMLIIIIMKIYLLFCVFVLWQQLIQQGAVRIETVTVSSFALFSILPCGVFVRFKIGGLVRLQYIREVGPIL